MEFKPTDSKETPRFAGISTFFRLPYVADPSDLDVAIIGVPFDGGQGYRTGSRFAPAEIRRVSSTIKPYNPSLKINPYDYLNVADVGDAPVNPLDSAKSRELIQGAIERIVDAGAMPVAVGGDHSISLPILRALARKYGSIGLIQVDSHLDTGDNYFGVKYGAGTPFRRAVEEELIDSNKWIQIGIRGPVYSENDFDFVRDHNVRCLTMDQIYTNGIQWVHEQLESLKDTICYMTFDIDGIDVAYAPGTSTPVPCGLTSLEAQMLIRQLSQFPRVVGFDINEVQPEFDVGSITSILAAFLTFEFICTRAVVKRNKA